MLFRSVISCAVLLFSTLSSGVFAISTSCMTYEGMPLNAEYSVGTTKTFGDIFGELIGFENEAGNWVEDGIATIENGGKAHGSGKETNLNNIMQRLIFNVSEPTSVTFKYADHGGVVNLGINGTLNNVEDLSDLNGLTVNGVTIIVTRTNTFNGHYGTVALIGTTDSIQRFAVGGQEFWLDDVCAQFP